MTYSAKCPHCEKILKSGHGDPIKKIGVPIQNCPTCQKPYIDSDIYEWEVVDTFTKLQFYFWDNNRFAVWLFIAMPALCLESLLVLFLSIALYAWVCFKYVNSHYKTQFEESKERASNPEYVSLLAKVGYERLDTKYRLS